MKVTILTDHHREVVTCDSFEVVKLDAGGDDVYMYRFLTRDSAGVPWETARFPIWSIEGLLINKDDE